MKKILACLLFLASVAQAQTYNNEWIDFSKTYYKFKVGSTGLRRIPQSTLAAAGLGSAAAQDFQLWRNGKQVPIYTSVATGAFGASDYIEFWGVMNDGAPDRELYRFSTSQLNDKWSLETDTAMYFLTVNPGGNNLRLATTINNVSGNNLPAETYFTYTVGNYFKNQINGGYAVNVGEYLYSSTYDRAEGWSSANIGTNGSNSFTFSNLFPYTAGPDAKFSIAVSGNATNPRRYRATLNGDSLIGRDINFLNELRDSTTFPVSRLSSGSAAIVVTNVTTYPNDRMVIHKYELTYPRQFNFGGASNFEFALPASSVSKYLQITGFSNSGVEPVLYDLTNGKRYVCDIATAGQVRVVLEPSATDRNLVLVSQATSNITSITGLIARTFTNYGLAENQANYLIISNPILFNGPNGSNPVEDYRAYRSSAAGGAYNAKIFLVDDLVDQFGFGIKKTPAALRNFLLFARKKFTTAPKHAFLIGKAVNYVAQRASESNPDIDKLNLVPTFGNPASDNMLAADPGTSDPKISIGRLSVVSGQEIATYLDKVKEYETVQRTASPLIGDKIWMKNVVHAVGANDPGLLASIDGYMSEYKRIISDTLFGAKVSTFTKSSPNSVQQANSDELTRLFNEGISLITYFGHSASTTLDFNLNNPSSYDNQGKYPMFIALGCMAGNFFGPFREETISEKFVLAPRKGTIGFLASSHFGVADYLDVYNHKIYEEVTTKLYGKSIGEILKAAVQDVFSFSTQDDFYARVTCEESCLNGDPAISLNAHAKPDYAIEANLLQVSPSFVSVADQTFNLKAKFVNIGKAINKRIARQVKREYPDGTSEVVYRDTISGIRYSDSLSINLPINSLRDKGVNKLTVTIDADNGVDELYETNNSVTKEIIIYEDEIRPIYPYNYSIVNTSGLKFYASTANPFAGAKTYRFEIDTTKNFNSSLLTTTSQTTTGGVVEFSPSIAFRDSTVYYWRVAEAASNGVINWNTNSFLYKSNSDQGFSQSHMYQHLSSEMKSIMYDTTSRRWKFKEVGNDVFVRHGTFALSAANESAVSITINGIRRMNNACTFNSLVFVVFDPITFTPWANPGGLYGSGPNNCFSGRQNNFEFKYTDTASRRKMMEFMSSIIPNGYYVIVRNFTYGTATTPGNYAPDWQADTSLYGSNNSLYHSFKYAGFNAIDSFTRIRPWVFAYKKGDAAFTPKWEMGYDMYSTVILNAVFNVPDKQGFIKSPVFGPAQAWKEMKWSGSSMELNDKDNPLISIVGIKNNGAVDTLYKDLNLTQQVVDISSINASLYPYLQLYMKNSDTLYRTPYQLKSWQLTYLPKPEGAVAPNLSFAMKDSFDIGEPINFSLAFKNISDVNFDSLKVKVTLTDKSNVARLLSIPRLKPLVAGDTVLIKFPIDSRSLAGKNSLLVEVNPDKDQPEQYTFNNFIFKTFYVSPDTLNPLIDVTFDNQHILNGDIVAAKPGISIKLSDNAKYNLLDDTSLVNIKVRFPNGNTRNFHFDNDTLSFIPAQIGTNTASINFRPYFAEDGDYELIVEGKDKSANKAGNMEYRVGFQVINKPMISNMLTYPNPFTTSTAFVFTITGSEVPQNLKIQILTITGKVIREITKEELGTLRVGRNITDFKWDGTDQYGQKVGNGVYLYRVITNLNGKSLDKYKPMGDKTDKYFEKGYGKMYLMR